MSRVVFPGDSYADLHAALNAHDVESCAIILAKQVAAHSDGFRLLVREIHLASESSYSVRTQTRAELKPESLVALVQQARAERLSIIFAHSHPNSLGVPTFSEVDDEGEKHLTDFLNRRLPNLPHASLVVAPQGCVARKLGESKPLDVSCVGSQVSRVSATNETLATNERWDRQIRAFGREGQANLQKAKVCVVGLGGTGSLVVQQLAYLGVDDFTLIDPDYADETNLNRLVGATPSDVGADKIAIAARQIRAVNPKARIRSLSRDVVDLDVAEQLTSVDAIFGCTDSHASRAILNQVAYQYVVPLFDLGVGIVVANGAISHIAGRVQMAAPGLPCLLCSGVIDSNAVRIELMTEAQRAADPYITGHHETQPAVISLNGVVASLAVTMFMTAFTSVPGTARLQYYNGITGTVRSATVRPDPSCIVCSKGGALARGDSWPLFGRVRTV